MSQTDVILAIQDPYMDEIINKTKNYEFRKYRLPKTVQRIWFYRTAPHSSLTHICEISPCIDRSTSSVKIDENGRGNKEFNKAHKDWVGYFAYKILSVYEIEVPITLARMMHEFSMKSAPQRFVHLPQNIAEAVPWKQQKKIFDNAESVNASVAVAQVDGVEISTQDLKF